jgi:hypothetical protein
MGAAKSAVKTAVKSIATTAKSKATAPTKMKKC